MQSTNSGLSKNQAMNRKLLGSILFLWFCGAIFADMPWQKQLGTITRSPMIFIAPALFSISLFLLPRPRFWNPQELKFFLYGIFTIFTSVILLFFYYIYGGQPIYKGINLFNRMVFASCENIVTFFAFFSLHRILRLLDRKTVLILMLILFLSLCIIAGIENVDKDVFQVFHTNTSGALLSRVSLLSSEPSQAFPVFTVIFFLVIFLLGAEKISLIILLSSLYLIVALLIDSKGGIPIVALSLVAPLIPLFKRKRQTALSLLICIIPVMVIISVHFYTKGSDELQTQIETYTSISTRLVGFCSSVFSLLTYPIGVGYGTNHVYYPPILLKSMEWIDNFINLPLNMDEVIFIASTGDTLSAKAGIPSQVVYNGFLAVGFFYSIFRRAWKRISVHYNVFQRFLGQALLIYVILSILFVSEINTLYIYIIPLVIFELPHFGTEIISC